VCFSCDTATVFADFIKAEEALKHMGKKGKNDAKGQALKGPPKGQVGQVKSVLFDKAFALVGDEPKEDDTTIEKPADEDFKAEAKNEEVKNGEPKMEAPLPKEETAQEEDTGQEPELLSTIQPSSLELEQDTEEKFEASSPPAVVAVPNEVIAEAFVPATISPTTASSGPTTVTLSNTVNQEDIVDTTYSRATAGGSGSEPQQVSGAFIGILAVLLVSLAMFVAVIIFVRRRKRQYQREGRDPESVPDMIRKITRRGRDQTEVVIDTLPEKNDSVKQPSGPSVITPATPVIPIKNSRQYPKLAPAPSPLRNEVDVE
jgi:hypothetical protein